MKKQFKIIVLSSVVLTLLFSFLVYPSPARAFTMSDIQSKIQALLGKINELKQQLDEMKKSGFSWGSSSKSSFKTSLSSSSSNSSSGSSSGANLSDVIGRIKNQLAIIIKIGADETQLYQYYLPRPSKLLVFQLTTKDWKTNQDMLVKYAGTNCEQGVPTIDDMDSIRADPKGEYPGFYHDIGSSVSEYIADNVRRGINYEAGCYFILIQNTSSQAGYYLLAVSDSYQPIGTALEVQPTGFGFSLGSSVGLEAGGIECLNPNSCKDRERLFDPVSDSPHTFFLFPTGDITPNYDYKSYDYRTVQRVSPGQSVALAWDTSDEFVSCTASKGWSGTKNTSGFEILNPMNEVKYGLTCKDKNGQSYYRERWIPIYSPPTLNYFRLSSYSINSGDPVTVEWSVNNAFKCQLVSTGAGFPKVVRKLSTSASGSVIENPTKTTTYSLSCISSDYDWLVDKGKVRQRKDIVVKIK